MPREIPNEVYEDRIYRPRLSGIHVSYIQDVCDFCLKYRYVKRNELYHRLHGKKVMCKDCKIDPKWTHIKRKDVVIAIREEQWDKKEVLKPKKRGQGTFILPKKRPK